MEVFVVVGVGVSSGLLIRLIIELVKLGQFHVVGFHNVAVAKENGKTLRTLGQLTAVVAVLYLVWPKPPQ